MNDIIKENDGTGTGMTHASLINTPGMGAVQLPTDNNIGSGDSWSGPIMTFRSWKGKRKKKKRSLKP